MVELRAVDSLRDPQPVPGRARVSVISRAAPRILVVDRDECLRGLLRLHLTNAGYEVETAEDAVVALQSIMRRPPKLMIVDVEVPYMDGLEFAAVVKGDPGFRHIPMIFFTAREGLEEAAKKLGAVAYLQKPLYADELVSAVKKALK